MSKNEDLKEDLKKICDSFFQCEDEEKLLKELKDNLDSIDTYLFSNLHSCRMHERINQN